LSLQSTIKKSLVILPVLFALLCVSSCSSFTIKMKSLPEIYETSRNLKGQCTPVMLEKVWALVETRYYREVKPVYLFNTAILGLMLEGKVSPVAPKSYIDMDKYNIKYDPYLLWHVIDTTAQASGKSRSDLCYAAISGITMGLDRWTMLIRPKKTDQYVRQNYAEKVMGTGIVPLVATKPRLRYFIDTIVRNSPSEQAGLKRLDELILIGNTHVATLKPTQLIDALRGPDKSMIEVSVKRGEKYLWFRFQRGPVDYKSAWCNLLEDKRVYCKIHGFNDNTVAQFEEAIRELPRPHRNQLIVDMRNNPGGLIYSATNLVAKMWLGHKRLAILETRQNGFIDFADTSVDKRPLLANWQTVFIADKTTASAGEMMLAAIQDHGAAVIIGQNTYGKGVGQLVTFIEGAMFRCTTLWVMSPNGRLIEGKGVAPDYKVSWTFQQMTEGRDKQLEVAQEYFNAIDKMAP